MQLMVFTLSYRFSHCYRSQGTLFKNAINAYGKNVLRMRRSAFSTQDGLYLNAVKEDPILVTIEGNIGAGKSTLLEALRITHPEWVFINEPVDTWSEFINNEGSNILEVFYRDRKRWSYTFQNCALLTRYQNIESAIRENSNTLLMGDNDNDNDNDNIDDSQTRRKKVFITERCLDTDYEVFTKLLLDEGSMDVLEYTLYKRWFDYLKNCSTPLSAIVHVDTPPDVCAKRIVGRGRKGEEDIPIQYLKTLEKYQSVWVNSGTVPYVHVSVDDVEKVSSFINNLS
jgi:deoxycitidine kinase/deoxyguanosine kinase